MLLNCGVGENLRVTWTARRSNQSILKEISPEYSLEGLMLKLKLQYLGHLMRRTDWCWERLKVGGEGDDRGWDGWMASLTQWTWVWVNSGHWWWTGRPGMLQSVGSQRVGHDWVTELNWTYNRSSRCFGYLSFYPGAKLSDTVYWIARSLPNKWNSLNIHDLKGPPFYTETKEIFDSAWIVTGTIRTY